MPICVGYEHEKRVPSTSLAISPNNKKDVTCVNYNGIANDPSDRVYLFDGEINPMQSRTIRGEKIPCQKHGGSFY
jgi:hypothetical protein